MRPDVNHQNKRLVVPQNLVKELFEHAHDQLGHLGFERTRERLSRNFYLFDFTKSLKSYLWHCHNCRVNATPRYAPFGSLQPILTPLRLFHTIANYFILALPRTANRFDYVMAATEKLAKSISIIPGKKD